MLYEVITDSEDIKLGFNIDLFEHFPPGTACGGLAISLEEAKRARIYGVLVEKDGMACLPLQSALANCRNRITSYNVCYTKLLRSSFCALTQSVMRVVCRTM